ncbi:ribosome maturation factor RimM [Polyangium aurulentum]|nr:ribosome maturation factor RimM [Polyangium aurulentum]
MTTQGRAEGRSGRRFVPVAEVGRAHGIRGEVRLKLYHEGSELLGQRPTLKLRLPDGTEQPAKIVSARNANKALLARLEGVDDRNAAEALAGAVLLVPRDEFPPLEEGEFYACDLEGARAVLPSGEEVGVVEALASYPTCEVLVIDRGLDGKLEVPLVEAYVASVDVDGRVVQLVTIEGLG